MAGPSLLVLSLVTIVCLLEYVAAEGATYNAYSITSTSVCSRFHKRELQVSMQSSILLEGRDLGNVAMSQPISCRYEIEYKSFMGLGGVVGVIQKMKFRHAGEFCQDYMQTLYHGNKSGIKFKKKKDKTKKIAKKIAKEVAKGAIRVKRDDDEDERGPRICGDLLFGIHVDENETLPPPFAAPLPPHPPSTGLLFGNENPYLTVTSDGADVDPKGELQTYLHISNRMLRVNESIQLKVVYSAYKVCNGQSVSAELFHCGYGLCISRSLVNDGFVNCPFGDCIDEGNCSNAKNATINARIVRHTPHYTTVRQPGEGVSIKTILLCLAGLLAIGGLMYYCVRKRKQANSNKRQDNDEEEEDGQEMQGDFQDPNKDQSGYPQHGYPPQGQPGYPPPQGYPQPGYPPQGQPGYPPQGQPGYPPQGQPGYPPQGQPGYPPPQGYPQPGYPAPQQGYPAPQQGYPAPQGYPPPQGQPGYPPPGQPGYLPPQGQPMYPGAGYPPPQGGQPGVATGVAPPLPEGGLGFSLPPSYPGATPGAPAPSSGEATAPSAPNL